MSSEYINREEIRETANILTKRLLKIQECSARNGRLKGIRDMQNVLKNIPAADVVEVVHCKDCRHRDPEDKKCDCGELERAGCVFRVRDDYYCAYGERGDNDD